MQTRDLMKLSLSHRIIIELASHIPILDLNHGYIPIQASAQCKWIIFSLSTLDLIPRKDKGSRIRDAGFTSLPPAASLRSYPPGLWVGVSPVLLVRWTAVKWVPYPLCYPGCRYTLYPVLMVEWSGIYQTGKVYILYFFQLLMQG